MVSLELETGVLVQEPAHCFLLIVYISGLDSHCCVLQAGKKDLQSGSNVFRSLVPQRRAFLAGLSIDLSEVEIVWDRRGGAVGARQIGGDYGQVIREQSLPDGEADWLLEPRSPLRPRIGW